MKWEERGNMRGREEKWSGVEEGTGEDKGVEKEKGREVQALMCVEQEVQGEEAKG